MALEKFDAPQVCTFAPPLPQRAFAIISSGSTTDDANWAGSGTEGVRYGYFVVNTSQWRNVEGFHTPPITVGEEFQVYKSKSNSTFFPGNETPMYDSTGAPDLFNIIDSIRGIAASSTIELFDPTVCRVVGAQQQTSGNWYVYYTPYLTEDIPANAGIVTLPKPYDAKWLGQVGHVQSVNYTYAIPGGPDQFTCTLAVEPDFRTDAMNVGRILQVFVGGSCVWEGILTEPQPASTGWTLTANGVGTYGTNFGAYYTIWAPDDVVFQAINRGLRWYNPGIGSPPGVYMGPVQDPGSLTITDFLNLISTGGAFYWTLVQTPNSGIPANPWQLVIVPFATDQGGNPLTVGPTDANQYNSNTCMEWSRTDNLKQTRRPPDLYLVNTSPAARTIQATYNTAILYYQSGGDTTSTSTTSATAATYANAWADIPSSVASQTRMEYYLDLTNAGTMTNAEATAVGQNVIQKFIPSFWGGTFSVQPGQLLNSGGFPVNLACNWSGAIVSLQCINEPYGGNVPLAPITFMIGQYVYDDESQTASVTPYQSVLTDIASVVETLYPGKYE